MKKDNVVDIKVRGPEKAVHKLIEKLEGSYRMIIVGKILSHKTDNDVHCFVNLDVTAEVTKSG